MNILKEKYKVKAYQIYIEALVLLGKGLTAASRYPFNLLGITEVVLKDLEGEHV